MIKSLQQSTVWPPPEGFIPIPSQVDGIELYAPAPEEESQEETRSFKCPSCGGVTAYNATQRQLTCAHCGRLQDLDAQIVGAQAASPRSSLVIIPPTLGSYLAQG